MDRNPKDSANQVKLFARRVMRRVNAAGAASMQLDDIEQELWIAWCLAAENYDVMMGVPFRAYLQRGMMLHINRFIEKNITRRHAEVGALSIDYVACSDDGANGEFGDALASTVQGPEVTIEENSQFEYAIKLLSPRAVQFVTILKSQPAELLQEVLRMEAKAEFAKAKGISMSLPHRLTCLMVFDLMDAGRLERSKIIAEVERLGDLTCQQVQP